MNFGASSVATTGGKTYSSMTRNPAIILPASTGRVGARRALDQAPDDVSQPPPASSSVFRHRSFRLYWLARVGSVFAYQMQTVAVGWQVYDLTASPLDLGLVGLAQFLPSVALVLVAGHVADRSDRR